MAGDDVLFRDVTTTSRGGKWFFSALALAQFAIWIPLSFEMGPSVFMFGLPGATIAAGLLLWYGVLRATVTSTEVVVQKGLRERRIPLAEIATVEVAKDVSTVSHMWSTYRARGVESFDVYGTRRSVKIRLRSGDLVSVMSDAPAALADAIERARADRAPVPRARVAADAGAEREEERASDADERPLDERVARRLDE